MAGPTVFMYEAILRHLNASYEIVFSDNTPGIEVSPGNWTGAYGALVREEADLMFGPFTAHYELSEHTYISSCYDIMVSGILSGPPRKVYHASIPLTTVLAPKTWITLIISWFLISLVYTCLAKIQSTILEDGWNPVKSLQFVAKFGNNFFRIYGLLFRIALDKPPVDAGIRVLLAGWLMLCVVFMTDVSSSFASRMCINQIPERIETLMDIVKYPKVFPYIVEGLREQTLFKTSKDERLNELWKRVVENNALLAIEDFGDDRIMADVLAGRAVFICVKGSAIEMLVGAVCQDEGGKDKEFYVGRESIDPVSMSFYARKSLEPEVLEIYNQASSLIMETGQVLYFIRQIHMKSDPCMKKDSPKLEHKAQDVSGLKQLFFFYFIGNSLAFVVLIFEVVVVYK